ncbi:fungal hydrophobin [Cyathus striatus]|nr:fungal hydrophobin [Cyathus striatus]
MLPKLIILLAFCLTITAQSTTQCNAGNEVCCNSIEDANSPSLQGLLEALGVVLGGITGQVGVDCVPISGGLSSNDCSNPPICCTGNSFNSAIIIGCHESHPVNINP